MKFNWRANWELLLVFVIIVVGIVITTIAAIKNRDKHPLALPEETTDFGLLTGGETGLPEVASNSGGAGLQPATVELTTPDNPQAPSDQFSLPAARRPQVQPMVKVGPPPSSRLATSGPHHQAAHHNHRLHTHQQPRDHDGRGQLAAAAKHEADPQTDYNRLVDLPASSGGTVGPPLQVSAGSSSSAADPYETMSTEPSPSQAQTDSAMGGSGAGTLQLPTTPTHHSSTTTTTTRHWSLGGRRHVNRTSQQQQHGQFGPTEESPSGPIHSGGESQQPGDQASGVDLIDGIHAIRSSLAEPNDGGGHINAYTGQPSPGAATALPTPQSDPTVPMTTPSLSMHGPYGVTPASSMNQLGQLLMHNLNHQHNQNKLDPALSVLDSEDMMTSYSRMPSNSSSGGSGGEALMRDYNIASSLGSSNSSLQQQQQQSSSLINSMMLANFLGAAPQNGDSADPYGAAQQPGTMLPANHHQHRGHLPSSLPISVLLSDLLKFTRGTRDSQSGSTSATNEQQSPASGIGAASNSPRQPSILQQLRALPGPLLALLQGTSSSPTSGYSTSGIMANDLGSMMPNHDASESSQHYHRISVSPTDIQSSILARSLRSSGGVLPAFPAPKGAPQPWIPPTAGGTNQHAALSSNADFVVSNVAGFVRSPGGGSNSANSAAQQQQQQQQQQMAASAEQQQQQQQQSNPPYQSYQSTQTQNPDVNYQRASFNSEPAFYGGPQATDMLGPQTGPQQRQQQQYQQQQQQLSNSYGSLLSEQTPLIEHFQQQQQQQSLFPQSNVQSERHWLHQTNGQPTMGDGYDQGGAARRVSFKSAPNMLLAQGVQPSQQTPLDFSAYMNHQQQYQSHQSALANQMAESRLNPSGGGGNSIAAQASTFNNHQPQVGGGGGATAAQYNQRLPSEMPVPLGYSPPAQQSVRQAAIPFEYNVAPVESSPRASIAGGGSSQHNHQQHPQPLPLQSVAKQQQQQTGAALQQQQAQNKPILSRRKRSTTRAVAPNGPHHNHPHHGENDMNRVDEVMSSKYIARGRHVDGNGHVAEDDDDDDSDSRPISVVRPDGRPMNSGRVRGFPVQNQQQQTNRIRPKLNEQGSSAAYDHGDESGHSPPAARLMDDRQVAQSQRSANHLELLEHEARPLHHYASSYEVHHHHHDHHADYDAAAAPHQQRPPSNYHSRSKGATLNSLDNEPTGRQLLAAADQPSERNNYHKEEEDNAVHGMYQKGATGGGSSRGNGRKRKNKMRKLETAGSGLMSKLLGTASTNDELEDDMDDDEDSANEKRKEELEDAEFGIVNEDNARNRPSDARREQQHQQAHQVERSKSEEQQAPNDGSGGRPGGGGEPSGALGSGSSGNEAYSRRGNQQRSDIEFYGHPGEETRQLKYGILGSGNYEVVNGGIYPEAEESTAAVNSVANYVRKPGALLSGLFAAGPGAHSGGGAPDQPVFMPGGRMPGGFMRGASASPDEFVGLMPGGKELQSPLLELIDAGAAGAGQLFDPSLLAHLGSSGSSSRTTHASREELESSTGEGNDTADEQQSDGSHDKTHNKAAKVTKSKTLQGGDKQRQMQNELEVVPNSGRHNLKGQQHKLQRQQSSISSSSRSSSSSSQRGNNQFNSYQILPSKKVTIFSDQDLDSAPTEQRPLVVNAAWLPLQALDSVRHRRLQPVVY